jgi:O-antigen/teichoic acid export membrane protein
LIKSVFKFTFNYTVANIISKLANFIILPFISYFISAEEFGIYSLIISYTIIVTVFSELGTHFYFQTKYLNSTNYKYIDLSFSFLILNSLIAFFIFSIFSPFLSYFLFGNFNLITLIILSLLGYVLETIANFGSLILKIQNNDKFLYIISLLNFITQLIILPIFILIFKLNIISFFITQILSNLLIIIYLHKQIGFKIKIDFNFNEYKNFLILSIPILFTNLLTLGIDISDRYILNLFSTKTEIGIYSFAYKFASLIKIVSYSFLPAFLSVSLKQGNNNKILENNFYKITFIFISLACSIFVLTDLFFQLHIFNNEYNTKSIIYLILNLSYSFYGIINFFYFYPYSVEKPSIILISDIIGFISNILLNILLIPIYGILGAAIATLFSYFLISLYLYYVVHKALNFNIDFNKLSILVALFFTSFVILYLFNNLLINIFIFITLNTLLYLIIKRSKYA